MNVEDLKRVVLGATRGPWELVVGDSGHSQYGNECSVVVAENGDTVVDVSYLDRSRNEVYAKDDGLSDAGFISTFDPSVVMELLDTIERLQNMEDRIRKLHTENPGYPCADFAGCNHCHQAWPCETIRSLDSITN